jgi:hypothetical protein
MTCAKKVAQPGSAHAWGRSGGENAKHFPTERHLKNEDGSFFCLRSKHEKKHGVSILF